MRVELHTYDTWGNAENGWDVNDVRLDTWLNVSDDATTEEVIQAFVDAGAISAERRGLLVFADQHQESIWLEIESKGGKPLGRIVSAVA